MSTPYRYFLSAPNYIAAPYS